MFKTHSSHTVSTIRRRPRQDHVMTLYTLSFKAKKL